MKEQIHELRTRIDGLSQLVKSLNKPFLIVDTDSIPLNMRIEDVMEEFEKANGRVLTLQHSQVVPPVFFDGSCIGECYKSLLLAKAWLGKVLAELGEETPYKNDGNRKTVEDIEPVNDSQPEQQSNSPLKSLPLRFPSKTIEGSEVDRLSDCREMNYIEKIDWLRERIKKLKVDFNDFVCEIEFADYDENFDLAQNHLTEARFHLGFELQRIKEQLK